jgi:hypothetical protein
MGEKDWQVDSGNGGNAKNVENVTSIEVGRGMGGNRGRGRPRGGDAWDVSSGGYDVDRFYTATSMSGDKASEASEKVSFRCDNSVWARAQDVVGSKKIPAYRNIHDFVRDAIFHRVQHLSGEIDDPMLKAWCQMMVRQGNMELLNRTIQASRDTVTRHQESFAIAAGNRDWQTAIEMIEHARETVEELSEPYATDLSKATDEFERKVDGEVASIVNAQKAQKRKHAN